MDSLYYCHECGRPISSGIYEYAINAFAAPLCLKHQHWISESKASAEAISLYFALKSHGLPVVLEYSDGQKTIDIAIPNKLYIEFDGNHHDEPDQELRDFLRTFHAWKEQIPTFRISNNHIRNSYHFAIVVDRLSQLCEEFKKTG